MKKKTLPICLAAFIITAIIAVMPSLLVSCGGYGAPQISISFDEIIHAGGELWGVDSEGTYRSFLGSNSLEGLENCAANGYNAIELDFSFTSDGHLVCIHDWSSEYIDTIETGTPLTYDEFMSSKIFWNFTPLDIETVGVFTEEHPDVYIITDIKESFSDAVDAIAAALPELKDRIVVQIYSEDDYDIASGAGFSNIIYTLYRLDWQSKTDTDALIKFERSHPLIGFTFAKELCDEKNYVSKLSKAGVPLYVHTVNDSAEIQKYRALGVYGVYTDKISDADTPD
jgi:glycerophosphoryl diester phosphodiesterase